MVGRLGWLFFCITAALMAQQKGVYWVEQETSLSSASEAVTIHNPTASGRIARMVGAAVYCSVACAFTVERDGSAPSSTAISVIKTNRNDATSGMAAYRASDVGSASRTLPENTLTAAGTFLVELEDHELRPGDNITIRTDTVSGTVRIIMKWREY